MRQRFGGAIPLLLGARLTCTGKRQSFRRFPEIAERRPEVRGNSYHAGLVTERFCFLLRLDQNIARPTGLPAQRVDISKRGHDWRQEQPDFALTGDTKSAVECHL